MSIGDLWPKINSSHGVDHEGAFGTATRNQLEASTSRPLSGVRGLKKRKITKGGRDATATAPPRSCGGGSAKSKAARILTDASEYISPHIKRSFVKRRYSPSTSMDWRECEIILEQLIIMGYVVKQEVVSEIDD
jgi:hypothetical protein